jgi:hypothetical protein
VSLSTTVQAMVAAGCTAEQIAAVVAAHDGEAAKEQTRRTELNGARQRRWRERHPDQVEARNAARRYAVPRDVTRPPKKERVSPTPPLQEKTPPDTPVVVSTTTPPLLGGHKTPRDFLLECLSAESADAVLAHRKAMRRPLTGRAAQLLAKGFTSTSDPNAAADLMIERGWQGFKPEWYDNERAGNGNGKGQSRGSIVDAGRKLTERLLAAEREQLQTVNSLDHGDPTVRLLQPFGRQRS